MKLRLSTLIKEYDGGDDDDDDVDDGGGGRRCLRLRS